MFKLVATYYFSKWVKAKAYSNLKDFDFIQCVWKNIICELCLPSVIVYGS